MHLSTISFLTIIGVLLLASTSADCYKILIFSAKAAHSHVKFMGKVADTLVDAGHEVVVVMPVIDPGIRTNGTEKARIIMREVKAGNDFWLKSSLKTQPFHEGTDMLETNFLEDFRKSMVSFCEDGLIERGNFDYLKAEKFDVAIFESFDYCAFGTVHMLGIPTTILASALQLTSHVGRLFGIPQPPSYVPDVLGSHGDEMGFFDRISNIAMTEMWNNHLDKVLADQNALFRKYVDKDFPCLRSLAKKSALVFVNSEEFLEFPRPISHKIIYVGGIALPKPKKLNKRFENILENSRKGTILVSFGSLANSTLMPMGHRKALIEAFSNFPEYNFIWKYEHPERDEELFNGTRNVFPVEWAPQVDLLNHDKLKVFVTHAGMNSVTESVHSGTPMITIPLFADQEHNAATVVKRNVGLRIDKTSLKDSRILTEAIGEMLKTEKYLNNAKRLKRMLEMKPVQSKDLLVKWTEFAAEFQDLSNLDLAGRDLSFIQYFNLDIFGVVFVALALAVCLVFVLLKFLVSLNLFSIDPKAKTA